MTLLERPLAEVKFVIPSFGRSVRRERPARVAT